MSKLPKDDLAGYLRAYAEELGLGDEEPATVLDRYHTPDLELVNDGLVLDRERLIAHATPARKNAMSVHVDVHDVVVDDDRVAARYTLTAELRTRGQVVIDVHMFGRLATDGRLRRVDQLTRTVSPAGG